MYYSDIKKEGKKENSLLLMHMIKIFILNS